MCAGDHCFVGVCRGSSRCVQVGQCLAGVCSVGPVEVCRG